ncbi:Qat anti-phage system associated protein QatB [uncultured Victivallis sp.]|uniref:Qat anti-phage system associated protein QatB n=1 Tax=uncultured Victivallis sp. TaxID=354118 RepID=UPI0025981DA7|nr:Qat anti-phage system associated protein QatB [uncultured Victivallis sp.]
MGTSTSFKGFKDKSALIPEWARENPELSPDVVPSQPEATEPPPDSPDIPPENAEEQPSENNNQEQPSTLPPTPPLLPSWRVSKTVTGRYARGTGNVSAVGRSYVRAKNGSRVAASSVRAGKNSLQRLGAFLADVSRNGLNNTLVEYGLQALAGRNATFVFSGIAEHLLPPGNDFDEGVARQAIEDALEALFNKCEEAGNYDCLEQLSSEDISDSIEKFVTGYIYRKWLQELGACIEKNSVSEMEALRLEKEIKVFVKDSVHRALQAVDPLSINWNSNEGKSIIDNIYQDAYSFIGEGEE